MRCPSGLLQAVLAALREAAKGAGKIGTTGRGIGPAAAIDTVMAGAVSGVTVAAVLPLSFRIETVSVV